VETLQRSTLHGDWGPMAAWEDLRPDDLAKQTRTKQPTGKNRRAMTDAAPIPQERRAAEPGGALMGMA